MSAPNTATAQPLVTPSPAPRGLWSAEALDQVEGFMLRTCTGERLDRLGTILGDHCSTGGKRLRARLALACAEALGVPRAEAVPWAAAVELLHNASLIHDDLQDGDRVRRGREATWVRHGVAQAINAGDLGLMLPYVALDAIDRDDATRWRMSIALARGAERVVRGQAAELELLHRERLSWDSYASAVIGKTAALFGLPVEGAALLAGHGQDEARALAEAFLPIGLLFQIQDDILDLYGDKGRGEPGADLREGKVSALVVEHLRLHPWDERWLRGLLALPREETTPHQVAEATERFASGGALEAVWGRLAQIDDAIAESPRLSRHGRLHTVAHELVARALAPIIHTNPARRPARGWA
ncbi:MAG: polyprenyl synthetase family protein [Alphaproteobacteria bacterium]|nr:polyprenyl synthetase family protein [Alphaproteobacteria bacterium]